MSNKVTASITFSFKGKTHQPSIDLDLDQCMKGTGQLPNLYPLIAKANNYDMYSYEYEMMQVECIMFSNAQGLIADFVQQGQLDTQAFEACWEKEKVLQQLQLLAKNILSVDDLNQQTKLKQALLDAYGMGKASVNKH